jgi:hypothetical protein
VANDAVQTMFEDACRRLFALHADGFKRPRPTVRPIGTTTVASQAAERTERPRVPERRPALAPAARRASLF